VTDGEQGLLIANKGLNEYEVLRDGRNTIAVTLLRASSELGDWGVFETPEAQCQGEQMAEYAIRPFAGDAAKSGAIGEAYSYPVPWTVVQAGTLADASERDAQKPVRAANAGAAAADATSTLPLSSQFVSWNESGTTMAFSALKLNAETQDVIVRWYNLADEEASLNVEVGFDIEAAYASDVLEQRGEELSEPHNTVGSYKIVTRAYRAR